MDSNWNVALDTVCNRGGRHYDVNCTQDGHIIEHWLEHSIVFEDGHAVGIAHEHAFIFKNGHSVGIALEHAFIFNYGHPVSISHGDGFIFENGHPVSVAHGYAFSFEDRHPVSVAHNYAINLGHHIVVVIRDAVRPCGSRKYATHTVNDGVLFIFSLGVSSSFKSTNCTGNTDIRCVSDEIPIMEQHPCHMDAYRCYTHGIGNGRYCVVYCRANGD